MNQHRRLAVPGTDKRQKLVEMGRLRKYVTLHWLDDVGNSQVKMPIRLNRCWPLDRRAGAQQSDQRASASLGDGFGDQGERTDMKTWDVGLIERRRPQRRVRRNGSETGFRHRPAALAQGRRRSRGSAGWGRPNVFALL